MRLGLFNGACFFILLQSDHRCSLISTNNNKTKMSEKLDVVGIGNAMVDAIIPSNQAEIEKHKINRDSMNLIDES